MPLILQIFITFSFAWMAGVVLLVIWSCYRELVPYSTPFPKSARAHSAGFMLPGAGGISQCDRPPVERVETVNAGDPRTPTS